MKAYIIHYKPLRERIQKTMQQVLACETIEDVEIVTSETSRLEFATEAENHVLPDGFPKHGTTDLERSVLHKHFRVLGKIAEAAEPAIILEDDVLFDPKDMDRFIREYDTDLPMDWCFFGTGLNMTIPGKGFVKNNNRLKSKCADSMLVHHHAADTIYYDWVSDKARAAIDWDLNYRFLKHELDVYWYEPGIITQGSENGTYPCCHNRN